LGRGVTGRLATRLKGSTKETYGEDKTYRIDPAQRFGLIIAELEVIDTIARAGLLPYSTEPQTKRQVEGASRKALSLYQASSRMFPPINNQILRI
jgi:hypothetical protein